ncbi:hypothetical protein PQJ75_13920 [Rhodoplanes sp. TEM]|uniref:Uncharacterized protein n=1 Tax=Rhodoplanes tepidamans TaxID=200616 RepID=A0ABT5JE84_RHOTP|nr:MULTISPECIES: hypothetical protein [Rhodoplanes]MDC7787989.1 hypothetical protein [Rhodoplanes tepidamans]MDC7984829.1 hypothetical protein [Rhodoplanes sp. TEM]MDQ0358418.1 hypothetical protein [Rhodoplanes tepidamans]
MKRYGTVDFEQVVAGEEYLRAIDELWRGAGYSRAGARGWADGAGHFSVTLTWSLTTKGGAQRLATYTIKRLRRA